MAVVGNSHLTVLAAFEESAKLQQRQFEVDTASVRASMRKGRFIDAMAEAVEHRRQLHPEIGWEAFCRLTEGRSAEDMLEEVQRLRTGR